MLVYSPLARDARVLRQIRRLSRDFDVTSAAFGPSPIEDVPHVQLEDLPPYRGGVAARLRYIALFVLGAYGALTRRHPRDLAAAEALAGREWDVVIANDATTLPLAHRLSARRGVLADLHEYAPRQGDESLVTRLTSNRYFTWLLRRYLPWASRVTTVSSGIAERYSREFGVPVRVVANAAPFEERDPTPVVRPVRIVHSAAPSPARRIEVMIEAVRDTSADVTLDLYLVDDGSSYVQGLRALAEGVERVRIHPPVANADLIATLAEYDIGVHLLPPINFNHLWALPNKLFDYVQARLGIIIGPSPEMRRVVETHGLGVVTDDFDAASLARTLDGLTPEQVRGWKGASHAAARALSGESQLDLLATLVSEIAADPADARRV